MTRTVPDSDPYKDFRRAVFARLERRESNEAWRSAVIAKVREAIAEARGDGLSERLWLFGSFAWGDPSPSSDLDIVVEDGGDPDWLAAIISRHTGKRVDVLRKRELPEGLFERIAREGIAL